MLRAWKSPEFRPAMDIDMSGKTGDEEKNITALKIWILVLVIIILGVYILSSV